eukprot:Awhi_evm1s13547
MTSEAVVTVESAHDYLEPIDEKKDKDKEPFDDVHHLGLNELNVDDMKEGVDDEEKDFEFEWFPDDRDFTWRSSILGGLIGGLIALSNIYLGLKVGITQGASLFAVMMGGIVVKPVLAMLSKWNDKFKIFGPKEHCCLQSSATSAGGLNGGLTSAVIALWWIAQDDTLSPEAKGDPWYGDAKDNIAECCLLVFSAVSFGLFLGVPMRNYFIVQQKLTFPDGFASAELIKTIYKKGRDEADMLLAKTQAKVIVAFSILGFVGVLLQNFIPIIFTWPIFHNLASCGGGQSVDACIETPPSYVNSSGEEVPTQVYVGFALASLWGWVLSFDPVMLGTAFIVPQRVNMWFFVGAVLAYAVIGPACMSLHEYPDGYNYAEGKRFIFHNTLLWPAVFVVIASSLSDLCYEWRQFKGLFNPPKKIKTDDELAVSNSKKDMSIVDRLKADFKFTFTSAYSLGNVDRSDEKTPLIVWLGGLIIFAVISFLILIIYFNITWWYIVVTMTFTLFLSIVFLQILGATNWALLSLMGKIVVITLGLAGGSVSSILICGNLVGQTMSQLADIVQSYKTGYMIGASPHAQFSANFVGNVFGLIFTLGGFFIFTIAFPCIIEYPTPDTCAFEVPSTNAWYSLAKAVNSGFSIGHEETDNMTWSGLYISVGMSIFAVITNGVKFWTKTYRPEFFKKYSYFFPLYSVILIPFLVSPGYAVATFVGGVIRQIWKLMYATDEKNLKYQVGSGLVCGGALGGAVYAVIRIAGVSDTDMLNWGF